MIFGLRRIPHDVGGDPAVGDHVLALLHCHRRHRRHRLDTVDVHLGELLHKGEHGVELTFEVLDLIILDRDTREMGDAANGSGVNGH